MFIESLRDSLGDYEHEPSLKVALSELKISVDLSKNPEIILSHFGEAIKEIGKYYDKKDYYATLRGLLSVIQIGPSQMSIIPSRANSDSSGITNAEKSILYSLCHATNDASFIALHLADAEQSPEEAEKLRSIAGDLLDTEREWGMKTGYEVITLKAGGNKAKLILERSLRAFYKDPQEGEDETAINIRKNLAMQTMFNQIVGMETKITWGNILRTHNSDTSIACFSVKAKDKINRITYPEGGAEISLKYVANFMNTLAMARVHYSEMLLEQIPLEIKEETEEQKKARKEKEANQQIDANMQIVKAKQNLTDTLAHYINFLEGKVPEEELRKIGLAIESNLSYAYIAEMYINPNLKKITLTSLKATMTEIHNHFIKEFLQKLTSVSQQTQDLFRAEALTRSTLIVGIPLLARTPTSPTLSFEPGEENLENIEINILNGIVAYAKDPFLSEIKFISQNNGEIHPRLTKDRVKEIGTKIIDNIKEVDKEEPFDTEDKVGYNKARKEYIKNGWIQEPSGVSPLLTTI